MSKEVSIFHKFQEGPYGGANQFMVALESEFVNQGYKVNRNSIGDRTNLVILNSFLFDSNTLRQQLRQYPNVTVVHRIDGPVEGYRGVEDGSDKRIYNLNKEFATITLFQSYYSYSSHIAKGMNMINPVVIKNAASQCFINTSKKNTIQERIKLVATSWSTNLQKGGLYYQWIDKFLDKNKYEFTFIGNTDRKFENSKQIKALPPKELAKVLATQDIYITASKKDPCSNSLIEAISCGLPVVYMNSGGHPEIVNGNGVPFSEMKNFGVAIEKCANSREKLKESIQLENINSIAKRYLATQSITEPYRTTLAEKLAIIFVSFLFRIMRILLIKKETWKSLRSKLFWNMLYTEQQFKEQLALENSLKQYKSHLNIPCDDVYNEVIEYISRKDVIVNYNPDYINLAVRLSGAAKQIYSVANALLAEERRIIDVIPNFDIIDIANNKTQKSTALLIDALDNVSNVSAYLESVNSGNLIIINRTNKGKEYHLRKDMGLNLFALSKDVKSFDENNLIKQIIKSGFIVKHLKYSTDNKLVCYAQKIEKAKGLTPVVSYGNIEINSKNIITGGKVKLIHLNEAFPQQLYKFNILYIVATALPKLYFKELILAAKNKGIKVVLNQNGIGFFGWAGKQTKQVNDKLSFLYENADYILFQSEFSRLSSEEFLGVNSKPWDIVYNCVDTNKFKPSAKMEKTDELSLLVIGSHHERERVFLAIDAVAELKNRGVNCRLTLCGRFIWSSFGQEEVEEYIVLNQVEEFTSIIGEYTQSEAVRIYQESDILLHLKYKDPCPTVPIEAMACGVPVVCSNTGGMPELVKDAGELIEVKDSWEELYYPEINVIVERVLKIRKNYELYSKKARNNVVNNFPKEKWIEQHKNVFSKVLEVNEFSNNISINASL